MAADEERAMIKIPVFSVLKNGIILKNIFLNNPNWENTDSIQGKEEEERDDDPILIGRHPDCHIVLDHPSISRFHLEIRARPMSQSLSVTDLDSVHGTWVSGEKIGAKIAVDLVEGDTVELGASTRIYELHWVPLSSAFEMENSLPAVLEENEEANQMQKLNEISAEEPLFPSVPPLPDSFSPEMEEFTERSPSFPSIIPMTESIGSLMPPIELENNTTPGNNSNANELHAESGKASNLLSRRSKSKSVSFLRVQTERKSENIGHASNEVSAEEFKREETVCRVLFDSKQEEEETFVSYKENVTPLNSSARKSHMKMKAVLTLQEELFQLAKENWTPKSPNIPKRSTPLMPYSEKKANLAPALASPLGLKNWHEEVFYSDKENLTPEVHREAISKKLIGGDCLQINEEEEKEVFTSDKENLTPQVSKSRKVKKPLASEFLKVDEEQAIAFFSNKDKLTPEASISSVKPKNFRKVDEEDAFAFDFTSDKENLTPVASGVKKSKKKLTDSQERIEKAIMERRNQRVPFQSLFENSPSKIYGSPLNLAQRTVEKERNPLQSLLKKSPAKNSPLKDAHRIVDKARAPFQSLLDYSSPSKKRVVDIERVPFQSLQKSPLSNKYSSCIHTERTVDEFSNFSSQSVDQMPPKVGESQKKWIMVVDTGCFLNEESRKSLQLLEGLRGTQLIIPRIVIRELDCLKRRESLFRKKTRAASSILQWIEKCMVKSSWWVHVQSSLETMPIASTPPATPRTQFDEANLIEIVSPTAEDHILDCALMLKRIKDDDGNFVILTNSVTLKIKAMAEGLVCETPVEFRESLVNLYSKRFLWSGSSPRGSTWSCLDEVALIENYYRQFPGIMKKTGKATESSIRGLKLILLHNSHYGKTSSVI